MSALWQAATSPNLQHIQLWRELSFHPAGVSLAVQMCPGSVSLSHLLFRSVMAHIPSNDTQDVCKIERNSSLLSWRPTCCITVRAVSNSLFFITGRKIGLFRKNLCLSCPKRSTVFHSSASCSRAVSALLTHLIASHPFLDILYHHHRRLFSRMRALKRPVFRSVLEHSSSFAVCSTLARHSSMLAVRSSGHCFCFVLNA